MDVIYNILDKDFAAVSRLSPMQVQQFERDGFTAIPCVAPPEDVAAIRQIIIRMHEKRTGFREGAQFDLLGADEGTAPRITQILSPHLYAKRLRRSVFFRNAFAVARQLLGPEAQFSFDHALIKPARTGAATPWHQDEAFRDPAFDYHELSVWMPLQPVNLENGCMEFLPGSQISDILPHRSPDGDVSAHALECAVPVDLGQVLACPLLAGGCTIHGPRTLHGTGANRDDAPRYAYVLGFNTPRQRRIVARKFPWRTEKQEVRAAREADWRRQGGKLILKWRDLQRRHPRWLLDDYI
jgi:hypothetical protein